MGFRRRDPRLISQRAWKKLWRLHFPDQCIHMSICLDTFFGHVTSLFDSYGRVSEYMLYGFGYGLYVYMYIDMHMYTSLWVGFVLGVTAGFPNVK